MKIIYLLLLSVATLTGCNQEKSTNIFKKNRIDQINEDNIGLIDYRQLEYDKLNKLDHIPVGQSFKVQNLMGLARVNSKQQNLRKVNIINMESNSPFPFFLTINCDDYTFIDNFGEPNQLIREIKPGTNGASWAYVGCKMPVTYGGFW